MEIDEEIFWVQGLRGWQRHLSFSRHSLEGPKERKKEKRKKTEVPVYGVFQNGLAPNELHLRRSRTAYVAVLRVQTHIGPLLIH